MKYAIGSNKEESYACVSGWCFPLWPVSFPGLPGFTFTDCKQDNQRVLLTTYQFGKHSLELQAAHISKYINPT